MRGTLLDGIATVHVGFVDGRFPDERFGAHFRVPPEMEHEVPSHATVAMIAGHVVTALGEVTWAGGHPLSRPVADDGVRWFHGDVI